MDNPLAVVALGLGAVLLAVAALAATLGRGPAADYVSRSARQTAAIVGGGLLVAGALLASTGSSGRRLWSALPASFDASSWASHRGAPEPGAQLLTPSPEPSGSVSPPGEGHGQGEADSAASLDANPEPPAGPQLAMDWSDATGELFQIVTRATPEELESSGFHDWARALPPGHKLFAVRVRVSNRGASDAELEPRLLTLTVSGQRAQLASLKGRSLLPGGTLRPGAAVEGLVVFAMPAALGGEMQDGLGELGYSGVLGTETVIVRK